MAKKQSGDMSEAGLDDPVEPSIRFAKSDNDLTSQDLERMCDAIEILANRAPKLTKAQLFNLQTKVGLAHRRLQKAIFEYVTRPRGGNVDQTKMEKVHGDSMQDAGLGADKELVIPNVGTPEKFAKTKKPVDCFGDEISK